jgi:predicted Zn-dependent protease
MVMGMIASQPLTAQAFSWADVFLRGIQLIQLSNISDQQEIQIGQQVNNRVIQQFKISQDQRLTSYVNEIGQRLVPVSERPRLTYTFQVVEDQSVNAFATMGGYVYIHRGLIEAADNEAQLASVIAHEMGHITGRHAVNQMRQAATAELGLTVAGIKQSTLVNIAYELMLRRPHSRRDEFDADVRGLTMLRKAGYAQAEMVAFMEKLLMYRSGLPTMLSTHPDTRDRVERLKTLVEKTPSAGQAGRDGTAYKQRMGLS